MYKSEKHKTLKVIAIVLVVLLVALAITAVIGRLTSGSWDISKWLEKDNTVTFNIDTVAMAKLTEKDFEYAIPVTLSQFMGGEGNEDEIIFAYILLISYDEATEELVVFATINPFGELPLLGLFVRAQGFPADEVPNITESDNIWQDYFLGGYEYSALLCAPYSVVGLPMTGVGYINFWLYMSETLDLSNAADLLNILVPAPSATLHFDAPGTRCPTEKIMNILIGGK